MAGAVLGMTLNCYKLIQKALERCYFYLKNKSYTFHLPSINSSVGTTLNCISCIVWLGFRGAELLDMDAHLRVNATYAYWCKV